MRHLGFLIGLSVHVCAWAWVLRDQFRFGRFRCYEESCRTLLLMDWPPSIFYGWRGSVLLTVGSFVLGSVWWGMIGAGVQRVLAMVANRDPEAARRRRSPFELLRFRGSTKAAARNRKN